MVSRVCDSAVDGLVILLRRTIYKDAKIAYRTGSFPKLETVLGSALNKGAAYLKRQESRDMIRFSLSYGLGLSEIGIVFVLIYLFI